VTALLLPRPIASSDALIAELRGFDAFGAKTVESEQDGIPISSMNSGPPASAARIPCTRSAIAPVSSRSCRSFSSQGSRRRARGSTIPLWARHDAVAGGVDGAPAHRQRHESLVRAADPPAPRAAHACAIEARLTEIDWSAGEIELQAICWPFITRTRLRKSARCGAFCKAMASP